MERQGAEMCTELMFSNFFRVPSIPSDWQVVVLDWHHGDSPSARRGGSQLTTLHVITFDPRTRFAKLRNPVRVRANYWLHARLGDWAGHGPAYLAAMDTVFKHEPAPAAQLWDVFGKDNAKLEAALGGPCQVVVASPGVRKTSLVLCQHAQAEVEAGGIMLALTPTTVSRGQVASALCSHGLGALVRVLGAQKLSAAEEPLTVGALVKTHLAPVALSVAEASSKLLHEVVQFRGGQQHQVPEAHQVLVDRREGAEKELGAARAAAVSQRPVCVATVGALLAPTAAKVHCLPKQVTLVAVDEAGALPTAELAILLCQIASHLAANC